MTKQEFYRNLQKANISAFFYKYQEDARNWTCYKKKVCRFSRDHIVSLKDKIRNVYQDISYAKASRMYDFIVEKGLSFDFVNNKLVIHYPEIILENSKHVIRDLYFGFNPILVPVYYQQFRGIRTTFTSKEWDKGYCHPHIDKTSIYTSLESGSAICFGETKFMANKDYEISFYSFLLYLDRFLVHEYYNPYRSTSSLYVDSPVDISPSSFNLNYIDWNKFDIEFVNQGNTISLSPVVESDNPEHIAELTKMFGQECVSLSYDNQSISKQIQDEIVKEYHNKKCDFKFQNKNVYIKIISYEDNPFIKDEYIKYFCNKARAYLTSKYLEAYSENFGECNETSEISVLQNI